MYHIRQTVRTEHVNFEGNGKPFIRSHLIPCVTGAHAEELLYVLNSSGKCFTDKHYSYDVTYEKVCVIRDHTTGKATALTMDMMEHIADMWSDQEQKTALAAE